MVNIHPRNNPWNRKYDFMDESRSGYLIEIKNGMALFAWETTAGEIKYYKCEENVFEKSFIVSPDLIENKNKIELDPGTATILRYPVET